ncbi:unnamed protein product [Allacma fusca]|uniref:F-box domain-containing protein n=1 Tax=Allacma fusca TaxID=39272 RepID=A0A8J2JPE5_9HEXA|nr:unnamed protein product [Allacma fusca]
MEVKNINNICHKNPDQNTHPCENQVDKALSNWIICRKIFQHLPISDLKTIHKVNKFWRREVDLCLNQYNLQFFYSEITSRESIVMTDIKGLRRETTKYELFLEDVTKVLKNAIKRTGRIYITLHLNNTGPFNSRLLEFVKTFGNLIFRLNFEVSISMDISHFINFVWKYLPNLEELHMDEFSLTANENEMSQKRLIEMKLINLTRISFFKQEPPFQSRIDLSDNIFTSILNLAPNLQQIYCFPLERIQVLATTNQMDLLKGIKYPHRPIFNNDIFTYLSKLAELSPKLQFFDPPRSPRLCSRKVLRLCRNYLRRIMESSKGSLEHLIVFPTQRLGYLNYPRGMSSVKTLEFANESNYYEKLQTILYLKRLGITPNKQKPWRRFFPKKFHLQKTFPNVEQVRIVLDEITRENCEKYFPIKMFQQINPTKMYTNEAGCLCLGALGNRFPSISHLTLDITDMEMTSLENSLKNLLKFRNLSTLKMEINSHRFFHKIDRTLENYEARGIFDSILTGIPDHICRQLVSSPGDVFREKEILKAGPVLDITGLKRVEFIFNSKEPNNRNRWFWGCSCFPVLLFSKVSIEFGFKANPLVNVVVRVQDEHSAIQTDAMMKAVGAAIDHIDLDMSYQPPFYIKTNIPI